MIQSRRSRNWNTRTYLQAMAVDSLILVVCFSSAKETYEGKRVIAKHAELLGLLNAFAKSIFNEWAKTVGQAANANLKQHLIVRNPKTQLISTNFDPQVRGARDTNECVPFASRSSSAAHRCAA